MQPILILELLMLTLSVAIALACQPWRMLRSDTPRLELLTPLAASIVILPVLWSLPRAHEIAAQLPWSGAVIVLLMLGWPLAVLVLTLVALLSGLLAPASWETLLAQAVWQGIMPATAALGLGAVIRRFLGSHLFVYILGRGFLGAVLCLFLSNLLAWLLGGLPPGSSELTHSLVGFWLISWGDAFVTGMLTAVFVSYRPQWLATWSDELYLPRP